MNEKSAKLILVMLDNGDSALFCNDKVVCSLLSNDDGAILPRDVAENLADSLQVDWHYVEMQQPKDADWNWLDVLELVPAITSGTETQHCEQLADGMSAAKAPWSVKQSDDSDYLYITRSGYPGEIHVKAEAEGFVVDAWRSGDDTECVATMGVMSSDLEQLEEREAQR